MWFLVNFFTGEDFRRITNGNARQMKRPKRPSAQTPFPWVAIATLNRKLDLSSVGLTSVGFSFILASILACLVYLHLRTSQGYAGKGIEIGSTHVRVVAIAFSTTGGHCDWGSWPEPSSECRLGSVPHNEYPIVAAVPQESRAANQRQGSQPSSEKNSTTDSQTNAQESCVATVNRTERLANPATIRLFSSAVSDGLQAPSP